MTKSKQSVAINLTHGQLAYVRELVEHDLTVGSELPDDDDSFDGIHAMAETVLQAIDQPMPVYFTEAAAFTTFETYFGRLSFFRRYPRFYPQPWVRRLAETFAADVFDSMVKPGTVRWRR